MVFRKVGECADEYLFEWLLTLSVAGSAVVACTLLMGWISSGHLPPTRWRYRLSKMAAVFYVVPLAVGLQGLLSFWRLNYPMQGSSSDLHPVIILQEPTIAASTAMLLIIVWAVGASTYAVWQVYSYRRLLKTLKSTSMAVPSTNEAAEQLARLKKQLRITSNVQLVYSSTVRSPVLVGLWKPTIYLPLEIPSNVDLSMVLHHELIHLKRKDLWVKALVLFASSLHWFNPLVHLLRKDIHTWSELSCDEEVVAAMSHAERKRYGETILNTMVGSKQLPRQFCASLSDDGKHLKRRLTIMLNVQKMKKKTLYTTIATVFTVAVIGTGAAAWAAGNTPIVTEKTDNRALVAEVIPTESYSRPEAVRPVSEAVNLPLTTDKQTNVEPTESQPLLIEAPYEKWITEPLVAESSEPAPVTDNQMIIKPKESQPLLKPHEGEISELVPAPASNKETNTEPEPILMELPIEEDNGEAFVAEPMELVPAP